MATGVNRRGVLALTGAAAVAAAPASGAAQARPAAARFTQRPLPFDPKSVPGLSEKLLLSHHDNNYGSAVRKITAIEAELAGADPASLPGYRLGGLKREQLLALNSTVLHEAYFQSFGPAAPPSPALAAAIERDFGSMARWTAEFSAVGKSLGGASGWVFLVWSERDQRLLTQWAADHTMVSAGGRLLVALDMYEHAYQIDYGANAAGYVDAYMRALTWTHANAAFAQAQAIAAPT
ncbi:MAG: superoxide dismutase [Caulobacter sp.]|nr:superoxide dismutase [Caulobacter sp.]